MPTSVLTKKIEALPQEYIALVANYVELLESTLNTLNAKKTNENLSQAIAASNMQTMWEELKNDTW